MKIELLDKTKKKKILGLLEENYGVKELKHLFVKLGKDKYRIFSGNLSKEEIKDLEKNTRIEVIGSRICTTAENSVRINFDMLNLPEIKSQITENIIEITDEQLKEWLKGNNLEIDSKTKARFVIIKHKNDFIGIARNQKNFLKNYVPKERRKK